MLNQFSRTQLLYGAETMDRLASSRVAVFGIGGVGGYAVEAMSTSKGVGKTQVAGRGWQAWYKLPYYDYD